MSHHTLIPLKTIEQVRDQCAPDTPKSVLDSIALQISRANEAGSRINAEGSVVRDMRGSVIPHPALDVETKAIKIFTDLLNKHKAWK